MPDHAVMEVDIRTIPGVRHDRLLEGFGAYLEGDIEAVSYTHLTLPTSDLV